VSGRVGIVALYLYFLRRKECT